MMMNKPTVAALLLCLAAGAQAQPVCTRADLQAAADSYVAAQRSGERVQDGS